MPFFVYPTTHPKNSSKSHTSRIHPQSGIEHKTSTFTDFPNGYNCSRRVFTTTAHISWSQTAKTYSLEACQSQLINSPIPPSSSSPTPSNIVLSGYYPYTSCYSPSSPDTELIPACTTGNCSEAPDANEPPASPWQPNLHNIPRANPTHLIPALPDYHNPHMPPTTQYTLYATCINPAASNPLISPSYPLGKSPTLSNLSCPCPLDTSFNPSTNSCQYQPPPN